VLGNCNHIGSLAYGENRVDRQRTIGVNRDAGALIRFETGLLNGDAVVSDGKVGERVESLTVGCGLMLHSGFNIDRVDACVRNHGATRIFDGARDAPAYSRPRSHGEEHEHCQRKT
jgi:hypothetical protein